MRLLAPLLCAASLLAGCAIEFDDDNGLDAARAEADDPCTAAALLGGMEADVLVAYPVTDGGRGLACIGEDDGLGDDLWALFEDHVPVTARTHIAWFVVFGNAADDTTEGFASPSDDIGAEWIFALNGESTSPEDLGFTIVHELGHVVSLNDTEVAFGERECATFSTGEGCARTDSLIHSFVQDYWEPLLDELFDLEDAGEDPSFPLCDAHPDDFFRAYNATNPGEDLAEMFAVYVFDLPTRTPTVEAKKQFFADVDVANDVRAYVEDNGVEPPAVGDIGDCE